jgi:hypothetical protein
MTAPTDRARALFAAAALLAGCSDEAGDGTLDVTVWGEEYIEQGIPAAEFEDGWQITYNKFLVVVGDVSVAVTGASAASVGGTQVLDLKQPGPHVLGTLALEAATYDQVGYALLPADAATTAHASASAADLDLMRAGPYRVHVAGEATKGAKTRSFSWSFADRVGYHHCVDVNSGQDLHGVVVPDGAAATAQLTIHGDHLFYDDLTSPDALLRFQHLADADADMDGEVTLAELDAVSLASLPPDEGPYAVGASDVNDLGAYVRAATKTLGHFNGEGHCEIE